MLEKITKHQQTSSDFYKFCLLIPTWNNLEYFKLCIHSIIKNSHYEVQIIAIINDGSDGTLKWVQNQKEIDYVHATENIGICYGLNIARSLIKSDYIVYVNDDMYLLPGWDTILYEEINQINSKSFMLSCTMIEPIDTGNPSVVVKNYGTDIESFKEELLLKEFSGLHRNDWSGSTWPPNVVHTDMWDLVGGLSVEFSPGMYSDPDFARKLFDAGVRIFKGKGNSLVYHFGSKSTKRVRRNNGRKTFILKWGITANTFVREYLHQGNPYTFIQVAPKMSPRASLINRLKRIFSC